MHCLGFRSVFESTSILFTEAIKARFQATLADVEELPAVECDILSQQSDEPESCTDHALGSHISDIDWRVEQRKHAVKLPWNLNPSVLIFENGIDFFFEVLFFTEKARFVQLMLNSWSFLMSSENLFFVRCTTNQGTKDEIGRVR